MRKSKRETEETRKRIVEMAADEFRQHGIVTSGIADLMAAVGLTHGGFYRHFESKEQLVAEATAAALDTLLDTLASAASGKKGRNALKAALEVYVCAEHRDNPRDGCPLAALGSELARSDKRVRDVAATGFSRMVEILRQSNSVRQLAQDAGPPQRVDKCHIMFTIFEGIASDSPPAVTEEQDK
jgi:TetR/AcrR family transcriptional repressor of nem operon